MKNKKQLFSLLLLASCSLIQQTVFAAAAAGGLQAETWQDYAKSVEAGKKLSKEEEKTVYNTQRSAGFNSTRQQLVGITFGELIKGLKTVKDRKQADLYKALLKSVQENIYNTQTPENQALGRHGYSRLMTLQEELKRLEVSDEIPLNIVPGFEAFSDEEEAYILWPLLVWAIEQNDPSLTVELYKIIGDTKKPYGKQVTPHELAVYLHSDKSIAAMKKHKEEKEEAADRAFGKRITFGS